jgi:hypothetical protein
MWRFLRMNRANVDPPLLKRADGVLVDLLLNAKSGNLGQRRQQYRKDNACSRSRSLLSI